jgi:hypothetical protein
MSSSLGVTVSTRTAAPPKGISVDTGTAFLACKPATGPTDVATLVHSVADYEAAYGLRSVGANAPAYDWLDTFFREGGQRCYVARYSTSPPLASALALFGAELGPGQVAAPEETPGSAVQTALIAHCVANNRVALFDVTNGGTVSAMEALGDAIPGFVTKLTKANLAEMLDHGVNGAAEIYGVLENYGFQTAVDQGPDNPYWQFNCSRARMWIAARAAALGEPFVFRPIDGRQRLQAALKGVLEGMLLTLYQADGLFGETPAEAFAVTVGASVNTVDTIAQGELHAVAEVRYSMAAKAVLVDLVTVPLSQALTAE